MRMYGYLKDPYKYNKAKSIYKVMIHEIPGTGVYTYYYTDRNAVFSSYDSYSENLDNAVAEFTGELDEQGWIVIDEPLGRVRTTSDRLNITIFPESSCRSITF